MYEWNQFLIIGPDSMPSGALSCPDSVAGLGNIRCDLDIELLVVRISRTKCSQCG
jgi:hypothetical protein